jgi:LPXTG-motif cell wall-anchored protein
MAHVKFRSLLGALVAVLVLAVGAAPSWAQYPPAVGAGKVTRSNLKQCQCTQFSGDGFAPGARIVITDTAPDGSRKNVGTAVADGNGSFTIKVCFDENSPEGTHTLTGRGKGVDGKQREVHSTVVVKGSVCYKKGDEIHGERFERPRGSGGLPTTGSDSTIPALLLGFGLVVAGSGVVLVFRRRTYATVS